METNEEPELNRDSALGLSCILLGIYVCSASFSIAIKNIRHRRHRGEPLLAQHTSDTLSGPLPPSPPPLVRLSEFDANPAPQPTRTPTPPFSVSKTIKRTDQPRQQSSTPSPLTATTGMDSPYAATSDGYPSTGAKDSPAADTGSPKGWDPALLQQCAQNEANICSLECLLRSSELQQHVRATTMHQNFDLHLKQTDAKLQTYRDLRAFDRDNFVQAYTRKDIKEYEERPPPLALLICDHAAGTALISFLLLAWLRGSPLAPGLLLTWLVLQALLAWRASHASLMACAASIFCVYGDDRYAAHQVAAGPVRTGLATLLDLLLVGCSLGVSSCVSLILMCSLPLRQTLGQRLMRIYPMHEIARLAETPLYTGSSPSPKPASQAVDGGSHCSPHTKPVLRGPMSPFGRMGPPPNLPPAAGRSSRLSQPPPPHPPASTRYQQVTPETQMPGQMRQPVSHRTGQPNLAWEELAAFSASRSLPRSPINVSKRKHD